MKQRVWRAVIETGFIVFLFYSNLLMGEFERSGMGRERGLVWALGDILTSANFGIAMIAAPLSGVILSPRKISPNSATDTGSVLMKAYETTNERWPITESIAKVLEATGATFEDFTQLVTAAARGAGPSPSR